MPNSLLSHWSQSACPHFDFTICPHTMVKTERLEPYYYFGVMRTVSDVSQMAFEWDFFSLAKVNYCGQKFRLALESIWIKTTLQYDAQHFVLLSREKL